MSAITKIHAHINFEENKNVQKTISSLQTSKKIDISQRSLEYVRLKRIHQSGALNVNEPLITKFKEFGKESAYDFSLSFLDSFVN